MAVNKIDPKVIFASTAPTQDTPAVFPNKTNGWGESRKNGGRPTIKQMNALQQETDLKILWLNENAVTPYDATIDYPNSAVVIKDGTFKILDTGVWKDFISKDVVSKLKTIPTYYTASEGVDPVTGVADGAYFNVRSEDNDTNAVEYQNIGGVPTPTGKSYPSAVALSGAVDDIAEVKEAIIDPITGKATASKVYIGSGDSVQQVYELQELHNKSSAVFTDYLTANELANKSTTDLSTKLTLVANDTSISKLRLTSGTYLISQPVVFSRDFSFDFDSDAFFKFTGSGSIKFTGSSELIGKPTSNISNASRTISIDHSGKLKPFDLLCIYNPSDYSFSPHRASYRAGEFIKVCTVTTGSITTFGKTFDNYASQDVDVYLIKPIKVQFNAFNVITDATATSAPVTFTFCEAIDLSSYKNIGGYSSGVIIDRCFDVTLNSFRATNNSTLIGVNYGISISNSQNVRIDGGNSNSIRHCISIGGGNNICSVPCREIFINNASLKTGSLLKIGAADIHGNAANCKYKNCVIDHANMGGKDNSFEDCTIIGRDEDGLVLTVNELIGGTFNITNCTFVINANLSTSLGIMNFVVAAPNLREDLIINIKGLKVVGTSTSGAQLIRFNSAPDTQVTKNITFNIDDFDCRLPNHSSILNVTGSTAFPDVPLEVNMSNIKTLVKSVYYLHPTSSATSANARIRLPAQHGSVLITTSGEASGFLNGPTISLPYLYPVPPTVISSVGTDGTWTLDSQFTLKPVTSIVSSNTTSQVRLALVSNSALPVSRTFKVSYQVCL